MTKDAVKSAVKDNPRDPASYAMVENEVIQCAIVGYGYWGRILSERIGRSAHFSLRFICDLTPPNRSSLIDSSSEGERIRLTRDFDLILSDHEVRAIFVATPPQTHIKFATRALKSGKHVWLEKPCGTSSDDLEALYALASRQRRALFLDFISVFNPRLDILSDQVRRAPPRRSGAPHQLIMRRENANHVGSLTGSPLDLVYDLGIHDLSILKLCYPELKARELELTLHSCERSPTALYPHTTLTLKADSLTAEIQLSWLAPKKRRDVCWYRDAETLQFSLKSEVELESEIAETARETAREPEKADHTTSQHSCVVSQERLYHRLSADTPWVERIPECSDDAIARALLMFKREVIQERSHDTPPSRLWDIGCFTHQVIERLRSFDHP